MRCNEHRGNLDIGTTEGDLILRGYNEQETLSGGFSFRLDFHIFRTVKILNYGLPVFVSFKPYTLMEPLLTNHHLPAFVGQPFHVIFGAKIDNRGPDHRCILTIEPRPHFSAFFSLRIEDLK